MNRVFFILLSCLAALNWACAQVEMELVFEQEQYLRDESLMTKIRILNSSGQKLRIGEATNWLTFEIANSEGLPVHQVDNIPLADAFDLESSKVASLKIDLMPYFDLSKMGHYTMNVALKVPQLNKVFACPPKSFDIVNGVKLWEKEFGVPSSGLPEMRKYSVLHVAYLKMLRIYVRVSDPDDVKVFKIVPLGMLVSFSKPETQIDKKSNLHILFQHNARHFLYHVINPDGSILTRQTYEYTDSRPTLKNDAEKGVYVHGGTRRVLMSDVPPPTFDEIAPLQEPAPTPTNEPPKKSTKTKKK